MITDQEAFVTDVAAFGREIRRRREAQGLSQRDLALAAGLGQRFISELENGKPTIRMGKALAVLTLLGGSLRVVEIRK